MKKEIKDRNKVTRERIKELENRITVLRSANDKIIREAQIAQQEIAQNNTAIIKLQGGIEELEKTISK